MEHNRNIVKMYFEIFSVCKNDFIFVALSAIPVYMSDGSDHVRIFMTAWFSKAARKARIKEDELCRAVAQVMTGQADDLGGGVFKKRLNRNEHRSIILTKWGDFWIYEYLFAKKGHGKH